MFAVDVRGRIVHTRPQTQRSLFEPPGRDVPAPSETPSVPHARRVSALDLVYGFANSIGDHQAESDAGDALAASSTLLVASLSSASRPFAEPRRKEPDWPQTWRSSGVPATGTFRRS